MILLSDRLSLAISSIDPSLPLSSKKNAQIIHLLRSITQQLPCQELSEDEKTRLSATYERLSALPLFADPSLTKASLLFQQCLQKHAVPLSPHTRLPNSLDAWRDSSDEREQEAYQRIYNLLSKRKMEEQEKDLPISSILDLSNLGLRTLPSLLFTDHRFARTPIKIEGNNFTTPPPFLTIGSLCNVQLYRQFLAELEGFPFLLTMGQNGQEGPLHSIASYLPTKALGCLAKTSQAFAPILSRYAVEAEITSSTLTSFLEALERSPGIWPHLSKLTFKCCPLEEQHILLIARKCPNITHLQISYTNFLPSAVIENFTRLPQLQHLDLSFCPSISDKNLRQLSSVTHLIHLNLTYCYQITDAGIDYATRHLPHLRYLNLAYCTQLTNAGVQSLARNLSGLQHLDLEGCLALTNQALQHLTSLAHLYWLNITYNYYMTYDGIQHLAKHLLSLRHLKGCSQLTYNELSRLRKSHRLLEITES